MLYRARDRSSCVSTMEKSSDRVLAKFWRRISSFTSYRGLAISSSCLVTLVELSARVLFTGWSESSRSGSSRDAMWNQPLPGNEDRRSHLGADSVTRYTRKVVGDLSLDLGNVNYAVSKPNEVGVMFGDASIKRLKSNMLFESRLEVNKFI